jgi:hypothetical protein
MRQSIQLFIAFVIGAFVASARPGSTPSGAGQREGSARDASVEPAVIDDQFVYDMAARFNESVTANVDAVDTELIAVLVGNFALAIYSADKISELEGTGLYIWGIGVAIVFSIVLAVLGYLSGSPFGPRQLQDGIRPRAVLLDLVNNPSTAIGDAVRVLIEVGEQNVRIRGRKRLAVLVAIVGWRSARFSWG